MKPIVFLFLFPTFAMANDGYWFNTTEHLRANGQQVQAMSRWVSTWEDCETLMKNSKAPCVSCDVSPLSHAILIRGKK